MKRLIDWADELIGWLGGTALFLVGVIAGGALLVCVWAIELVGLFGVWIAYAITKLKMWLKDE